MKLLVIEDEVELCHSMVSYLKSENYSCEVAHTYRGAMDKIDEFDYDCILLDITLPDGNGLRVLRELKDNRKSDGVIIVSAKDSIDDKINGLRIGADDYLPKPFHLSELSARIAAIIRRKQFTGNNLVSFNELEIDTLSKEVRVHDHILELTRKEYQLLLYFIVNKGRVISRNAIAEHLWGAELDLSGSLDFIYTHIKNLRKKLHEAGASDYIRSLYGMGYKFTE